MQIANLSRSNVPTANLCGLSWRCRDNLQFSFFNFQFAFTHRPAFTASSRHELFPFDLRFLRARGRNHQPSAAHLRKGSGGPAQLTPPPLLSSLASPKVPLVVLAKTRPTSQPSRCIPPPPRTPA